MFQIILLLHLFFLPIKGDVQESMLKVWDDSEVNIFYSPKYYDKAAPDEFELNKYQDQISDCYGYLLSKYHILTATSCFMDLRRISEMLENQVKHETVMETIFNGDDMRPNIEKFEVAQLIIYIHDKPDEEQI